MSATVCALEILYDVWTDEVGVVISDGKLLRDVEFRHPFTGLLCVDMTGPVT